jgi:hypothetical protein
MNQYLLQAQLQQQPSFFTGDPNAALTNLLLAQSMASGASGFNPGFNRLLSPSSSSAGAAYTSASGPITASLLARARQNLAPGRQHENPQSQFSQSAAAIPQRNAASASIDIPSQGSQLGQQATSRTANPSGRAPLPPPVDTSNKNILYLPSDEDNVNAFQRYARQQIEFFEAGEIDARGSAQGRNKPVVLGQGKTFQLGCDERLYCLRLH